MKRQNIPLEQFRVPPFDLWEKGMVLSAGDFSSGRYNAMTVAWGSIGRMWNMPFVQVVVRPVRFTYEFMEGHDDFTLCAFPPEYRKALQILGTRSGRHGDKIGISGLTPQPASCVTAPAFEQAEWVIECRKIYSDDFRPARFLDEGIQDEYPNRDFHRFYFGKVLAVFGIPYYH
ncbi:flavin reductase [bacterium]|nr:flavin reductase [bacterium]